MEIRNIQKTGGSSFSLTLPKDWIRKNDLQDKDKVVIYTQNVRSMIIVPYKIDKYDTRITIAIDTYSKETVRREIVSQYLAGRDEIILTSEKFSPSVVYIVRETVLNLIGVEIIEQTLDKIVIKNVFDSKKFSIRDNVEKMFSMIISMYKDVLTAMEKGDKNLALHIIDRDAEVDKLCHAVTRQYMLMLQNKITEEETGVSVIQLQSYEEIAIQLERIEDHTVKIAKMVNLQSRRSQKLFNRSLQRIAKRVLNYLLQVETCFRLLDKNKAHEIVDFHRSLSNTLINRSIVKKSSIDIVIEDSLDRIRGYITNIAEEVIDYLSMQ